MEHKELYFEGTQVKANADLCSLVPRFAVEARAAIQEHLAAIAAASSGWLLFERCVHPAFGGVAFSFADWPSLLNGYEAMYPSC